MSSRDIIVQRCTKPALGTWTVESGLEAATQGAVREAVRMMGVRKSIVLWDARQLSNSNVQTLNPVGVSLLVSPPLFFLVLLGIAALFCLYLTITVSCVRLCL